MPSFAIEAPGEANPLTESALLHTLQAASSRDPNQIQSGTKQLQQWEKSEGFYKHLQSVYITRQLPVEVRYLAIIQLKNGIDKYWRKTATNAVNKEDKAVIRSRLISGGVDEEDHRLALQNALVTAKIVRFEYPHEWPDAISNTLDAIRACTYDSSSHRLERSLLILLYIIKELSTARIQRSRTNLQAATPEILAVLGSIYVEKINQWQRMLQHADHGPQLESSMSQSLLSIKTLRRLLISGYEHPHRDNDVRQFWELTLNQVQAFMNIIHQQSGALAPEVMRLVERHLHQLSKFHLDMADKHPAAFVLLPSSLPLVHAYWSFVKHFSQTYGMTHDAAGNRNGSAKPDIHDDGPSISEKLSLNGLLLIRACIRMAYKPVNTFKYKHPEEKEERKQAEIIMKQDLLTQQLVEDIMTVIMTKFLVLRQSDLRDWTEDPEDWVTRQENESEDMNLSVRACSERLVLDLSTHFKATLTGPIMSLFHSVSDVQNEDVFFKDAVYAAIGMAAAMFKDDFDFDQLLSTTLVQEIQKQSEGANIMRRRVAIFAGQWVVVKVSKETRPMVYQVFDHLLQRDDKFNDEVVRITAGCQFKNVVDDFDFDAEQFAPHAESIITKIMGLIEEVELTSTKLTLLETISALIERFGFRIEPFADRIVNMLPTLWEQSGDEHMMKQSILTVLARLVQALKQSSGRFHAMLIPIISNAVQSDSEMQIYLLEEALDLWRSILVQTTAPTPEIMSLVQHLFPFYDLASESLRAVLEITESYIYLAPESMRSDIVRRPILTKFASLIGPGAKSEMSGMVCNCIELMISSVSLDSSDSSVPPVSSHEEDAARKAALEAARQEEIKKLTVDMVETQFLPRLLAGLRSAWVAHCTTGPLAKTPVVDGYVETDYFAVLARILLASPGTFLQAMQYSPLATDNEYDIAPSSHNSSAKEGTLKWLTEEWFSHQENIGDPARRKLNALALTTLFGTFDKEMLGTIMLANLQLMMTLWTDIVMELVEPEPEDPEGAPVALGKDRDCLVYTDPIGLRVVEEGEPEEPEEVRRRKLKFKDPVHQEGLPKRIRQTLAQVVQGCGGEESFREQWLVNVDREVVAAFGRLGIMG